MLVKELITVFLITGSLAIESREEFSDESRDVPKNGLYLKPKKHLDDNEKPYKMKPKHDAARQLEKDYSRWSDKKFLKQASDEIKGKNQHTKINEIDDNDFIDKYNKFLYVPHNNEKKGKSNYHDKNSMKNNQKEENEKPGSLLHDTNVNYIDNNKKVSGDSEVIAGSSPNIMKNKENYQENYQNRNEKYMKRYKKDFYQNLKKIDLSKPPTNDTVLMARYLVHTVDWAALGTISGRPSTKGAPFVCVKATSDGMESASTGIPFFYMSPRDLCTQDLQKDNRVSVLVTLSETEYCKNENLDPQDPRCAKLTLSGKIKKIKPGSDEEKFAKNALFSRHPAMASWPADHSWYFTKLKIGQIVLLDKFGGATYIKVKDYLNGGQVEPEIERS